MKKSMNQKQTLDLMKLLAEKLAESTTHTSAHEALIDVVSQISKLSHKTKNGGFHDDILFRSENKVIEVDLDSLE